MSKKTIIVVGCSASQAAIAKARQFDEHARIIWVKLSSHWFLENFGHYLNTPQALDIKLKQVEQFKERYNVECFHDFQAAIDVDARLLLLKSPKIKERIHFDSLIFAGDLFSTPVPLESELVCGFSTTSDLEKINQVKKNGGTKALVLGLSIEGINAALSLKEAGFSVALLYEKSSLPFSWHFSEELLARLALEVSVVQGQLLDICEHDEKIKVSQTFGELEADLVVVGKKASPNLSLLSEAGALVDQELMQVDDQLMSSLPDIFACGSAVSVPTMAFERHFNSLKTAHVAGYNAVALGTKEKLKSCCHAMMVKVGTHYFARTGVSELNAYKHFHRDNVITTTVYQNGLCIRIMVEKKSERIVGAEIFGESGVKRRIDLLSLAIAQGFSPKVLMDLEMVEEDGFALDPLKEAAARAQMALADNVKVISADGLALWLANNQSFSLVNVGEAALGKKILHIPLEKLRSRIKDMEITSPIVLYSESGDESFLAQQALGQRGLHTYHLDGGLLAWEAVSKK